ITSAPKSDSIVAAAGAAMKLAISTTFRPENTDSVVCVICVGCVFTVITSLNERAQAGARLADDQRLHLAGALIGVESLGSGDKTADVVVEDNAVAAQQLPCPVNGLAHPRRAIGLRQRGLLVAIHPVVLQLGQAHHHP